MGLVVLVQLAVVFVVIIVVIFTRIKIFLQRQSFREACVVQGLARTVGLFVDFTAVFGLNALVE